MKKKTYKIKCGDEYEEVEGYVFNDMWGIDKREQGYFVLTHIPSGCLADSAGTMKYLKMMVQEPEFFDYDCTPEQTSKLAKFISDYKAKHGWGF